MADWLLVDIGNSRIKIAKASNQNDIDVIATFPTAKASEAGAEINKLAGELPIALCSVVASATECIKEIVTGEIFEVVLSKQQEIKNLHAEFGFDRLADVIAARHIYAGAKNLIVMGLGSATVLTAVSSKGDYLGGFITLGMTSTLDAIKQKIPALPIVSPEICNANLGKTTIESVGNGTLLAQAATVDRWIEEAKKAFAGDCITVATGGCLESIGKHTQFIDHFDPLLTLKGTYILAQRKRQLP